MCFGAACLHLPGANPWQLSNNTLVANGRAEDTASHLRACNALRARNPAVKILLSVGHEQGCCHLSAITSSASAQDNFAKSSRDLIRTYGLDGIDGERKLSIYEPVLGRMRQQSVVA